MVDSGPDPVALGNCPTDSLDFTASVNCRYCSNRNKHSDRAIWPQSIQFSFLKVIYQSVLQKLRADEHDSHSEIHNHFHLIQYELHHHHIYHSHHSFFKFLIILSLHLLLHVTAVFASSFLIITSQSWSKFSLIFINSSIIILTIYVTILHVYILLINS